MAAEASQFSIHEQLVEEHKKLVEKEVTNWLSPADYEGTFKQHQSARLNGTCTWIRKRSEFTRWICQDDDKGQGLWVHGSPGCGKTILASYVIEAIVESGRPVVYFFCTSQLTGASRGARRDETLTVIRTLIYQLALLDRSLLEDILEFREESKLPGNLSADTLWDLFVSLAKKFEQLHCVIDGLDECVDRENEQLLRKLMSLKSLPGVRMLMISRNIPDIYRDFRVLGGDPQSILKITPADVREDNESFIKAVIKQGPRLGSLPEAVQAEILQRLQVTGDGLILYSKLLLRKLENTAGTSDVRDEMEDLPTGLHVLYETIYKQLQEAYMKSTPRAKEVARLVFAFAVFGSRPLGLKEFSEASMVRHGSAILSEPDDFTLYATEVQNIELLASPLIEIVGNQIRVIHHSARQFLEEQSKRSQDEIIMGRASSHRRLLECCLDYLSLDTFQEPLLSRKRFEEVTRKELAVHHPFLAYAAQHWSSHLQPDFDTPTPNSAPSVLSFLDSRSFVTWIQSAIIFSSHLDNLAYIMQDVEQWVSKAPDGHLQVFRLSQWLQRFRESLYDWCESIHKHPGEVHFIHDFMPLGSTNPREKTQTLMRFEEEKGRRIFPQVNLQYDFFVRQGTMVALARKRCANKDSDEDDVIAISLHDWHLGNCIKVLRLVPTPGIPEDASIGFRCMAFSPDGRFIAGAIEVWDTEPEAETFGVKTVVWPVTGSSGKARWTHNSSPTESYGWSVSSISFPSPTTILCPSGLFEVETGHHLADLPDEFNNDCCSLTFHGNKVGLIRSTNTLEVWRVDPTRSSFDRLSSLHIRRELGWDTTEEKDNWVIRDISSSGNIVLLTDYSAMVTFDVRTGKFHHYYTLDDTLNDLRAIFSPDEKKFVVLVKGYKGLNFHIMLCTSTFNGDQSPPEADTTTEDTPEPFVTVRKYANMQPPTHFRFDPNSDIIHACGVQKSSYNWLSIFHSVDCRREWADDADSLPSESQAYVFGFSKNPDVLHVSKIPSPSQPMIMDASVSFTLRGKKSDDDDEYEAAHWSQQKINHQCWSFKTGTITSSAICPINPELHDIIQFFRRYPHGMTESDGFVRFMGNTFELIDGKLEDFNFPIVWDMQSTKANLLQHKGLFDPPLEDDTFCAHLEQTVLSIPQKAVAMVGAFDKPDDRDGTQVYPSAYSHPFIVIRKLDDTAELLWEWHGQKPEFSSSNLVVSFAFSPDPESGLFAFSTRAAMKDGDGLYFSRFGKKGLHVKPQLVSKRCAHQLIFSREGDLLFAITGRCEKKDDGTYDSDYYVLSVYNTESFEVVRRLVGRSPFSRQAQGPFLSWQLAENGQDLESIHVSKTTDSQAVHAKLCTTTGILFTRILGSLPTMGGAVEVSRFAIDESSPNDVRFNVAFRFTNISPIAISFPDIIAGPWEYVPGILLTDDNKALYRSPTMYLIANIEWMEYQEDQRKLQELEKEMDEQLALYTLGMEQEEPGTLIQVGAGSGDTRQSVAERIQKLNEEIDKARENVVRGVKRMREILRYPEDE